MWRLIFAHFLALGVAAPVLAWSEPGHMTTGAIAYDDLAKNNPALLPQIEAIIAAHPDQPKLAKHLIGLSGAARTRDSFEWLARWADDIRGSAYDHPEWHYELRVVSSASMVWPFRNGSAREGFDINFKRLQNTAAPMADRAIALGWLLHIVGDIQQPLHAGHWMSWRFKATDRAGTLGFVRRTPGGAPVNLHEYWDQMFDQPGQPEATPNAWAVPLAKRWSRAAVLLAAASGTPQQQFSAWLDESKELASSVAYKDAFLRATIDDYAAPAVSANYRKISQSLGQQRLAAGGYRIADTLKMALAPR